MSDDARPVYIGHGTCRCGRIDVLLYQLPNTPFKDAVMCSLCVEKAGFEVPKPRTADDIETVNGKFTWKKS